ncbi:MAG: helix-turn-helix transcriptional regulator [Clostridiaceae bacterium]
MEKNELNLKLLSVYLFKSMRVYAKGYELQKRYVHDYEIELILNSNGGMWINDYFYKVNRGDIIFKKPNDLTQGIMAYDCYCVIFKIGGYKQLIEKIPVIINFKQDKLDRIITLIDEILREDVNKDETSEIIINSNILKILSYIYKENENYNINKDYVINSSIKKSLEFINNNIENQLSLDIVSKQINLSPNYYHSLFSKAMGITLNEYIINLRLNKAKELLVKTGLSISEIALICGFNSISYFSYIFKKEMEISPSKYKEKILK